MADNSGIEWTEATWNPIVGCTHVSAGCAHCYAAREASGRLSKTPTYAGLAVDGKFTGEVRLLPERLDQPERWRQPRRVFVNSMADLFHDSVPDGFIGAVFERMARSPRHTFQVLTKRHGRLRSLLNRWASQGREETQYDGPRSLGDVRVTEPLWTPPPNIWLGVSVEDQHWANIRIPALLDTPAAVRWISAEPLLGPVDLTNVVGINALEQDWIGGPGGGTGAPHPFLDWVVTGGESGPGARPAHPDWFRSIRDQCQATGVAYLHKQNGEHLWEWHGEKAGWQPHRVGKKAAGRELDGRTWDEYPERVST